MIKVAIGPLELAPKGTFEVTNRVESQRHKTIRLRCSYNEYRETAQILVFQSTRMSQLPLEAVAGMFPIGKVKRAELREELFNVPPSRPHTRPLVVELKREGNRVFYRVLFRSFQSMQDWAAVDSIHPRINLPPQLLQPYISFTAVTPAAKAGVIVCDGDPFKAMESAIDTALAC